MRAVKNNLPTPSGEVEESEGPRRDRASLGEPWVGREEWSPQSKATQPHPLDAKGSGADVGGWTPRTKPFVLMRRNEGAILSVTICCMSQDFNV